MISNIPLNPAGQPKYQAIAAELAAAIVNGQLAPGEKLPPHRVLAKRLGVTTGTVSRAYAWLEQQALALARVGDGTYVRNLDRTLPHARQPIFPALIDMAHKIAIPTEEAPALLRAMAVLGQSRGATDEVLKYHPMACTMPMARREAIASVVRRRTTCGFPCPNPGAPGNTPPLCAWLACWSAAWTTLRQGAHRLRMRYASASTDPPRWSRCAAG